MSGCKGAALWGFVGLVAGVSVSWATGAAPNVLGVLYWLAWVVAFAAWFWLAWRHLNSQNRADQQFGMVQQMLAGVDQIVLATTGDRLGKSAPRTEAPEPEVVGKAWGLIDMVPAERRPSPVKRVPTDTDEMDRVDVEQARDAAKHGRHSVKGT